MGRLKGRLERVEKPALKVWQQAWREWLERICPTVLPPDRGLLFIKRAGVPTGEFHPQAKEASDLLDVVLADLPGWVPLRAWFEQQEEILGCLDVEPPDLTKWPEDLPVPLQGMDGLQGEIKEAHERVLLVTLGLELLLWSLRTAREPAR